MGCFSWIAQDTNKPIYIDGYHNNQGCYDVFDDE